MLIVSKLKDYYDSAIGVGGVDKTCVFQRQEVKIKDANPFKKLLPKRLVSNKTETVCTMFVVGFCGKLYVGAHFANTPHPSPKNKFKSFYMYGKEAIEGSLRARGLKERAIYYYIKTAKIPKIIDQLDNKSNLDLFFEYKVPIFTFGTKLVLNPRLKRFEFYKVFDSYSAFQEIHMFLSGVLGNKEKETINISDMDRLTAHGFDKKTSFRKEKQNRWIP